MSQDGASIGRHQRVPELDAEGAHIDLRPYGPAHSVVVQAEPLNLAKRAVADVRAAVVGVVDVGRLQTVPRTTAVVQRLGEQVPYRCRARAGLLSMRGRRH